MKLAQTASEEVVDNVEEYCTLYPQECVDTAEQISSKADTYFDFNDVLSAAGKHHLQLWAGYNAYLLIFAFWLYNRQVRQLTDRLLKTDAPLKQWATTAIITFLLGISNLLVYSFQYFGVTDFSWIYYTHLGSIGVLVVLMSSLASVSQAYEDSILTKDLDHNYKNSWRASWATFTIGAGIWLLTFQPFQEALEEEELVEQIEDIREEETSECVDYVDPEGNWCDSAVQEANSF